MTEREMIADLRALVARWGREAQVHRDRAEVDQAEQIEDCIADVKELIP